MIRNTHVALILILLVAAALRLYGLGDLPPGLYHDEAYYGLDALGVLEGDRPVFFEANNGREPLFIYLCAASIAALGRTPVAIRLVAAIIGTLTVLATFYLGRSLFNTRIGLLTAAITAITVWTINLSRIGFRAVTMPLIVALCVWQGALAFRTGRLRHWVAAGVLYGLLFYTYLAARLTPLALAVVLGVYWLGQRRPPTQQTNITRSFPWRGLLVAGIAACVVAFPLLVYLATHAGDALARGGQVSILNPAIHQGDPLGLLGRQLLGTAGMFLVRGDFIPRHNVPLRPVFDPGLGLMFAIGVFVALRQWRRPGYGFVLAWTGVMLLPTILAEDAPHFLRATGILPVALLLPAVGLDTTWRWAEDRGRGAVGGLGVSLILLVSLGFTWRDYFQVHAHSAAAYYQFETGATDLAVEINRFLGAGWQGGWTEARTERLEGHRAYIEPRLWDDWANVRYLATPSGLRVLTPGRAVSGDRLLLALWPFADHRDVLTQLPLNQLIDVRVGALERGDLEPQPRLLYYTLRVTPDLPPATLAADFGLARLQQGSWQTDGGKITVKLVWLATGPLPETVSAFVHAVGDNGLVDQADGPPGGLYPASRWRSGDTVAEERWLTNAEQPRVREVRVGLYDTRSLQRLRQPNGSDFVTLPLLPKP